MAISATPLPPCSLRVSSGSGTDNWVYAAVFSTCSCSCPCCYTVRSGRDAQSLLGAAGELMMAPGFDTLHCWPCNCCRLSLQSLLSAAAWTCDRFCAAAPTFCGRPGGQCAQACCNLQSACCPLPGLTVWHAAGVGLALSPPAAPVHRRPGSPQHQAGTVPLAVCMRVSTCLLQAQHWLDSSTAPGSAL